MNVNRLLSVLLFSVAIVLPAVSSVPCNAGDPPASPPTLAKIGQLNKTTMDLVHSVSLTLEYDWKVKPATTVERTDSWRRTRDVERITWRATTSNAETPHFLRDVVIDRAAGTLSKLDYLGPEAEIPTIEIGKPAGVQGTIMPVSPDTFHNAPAVRLGLRFQLVLNSPSYTLDEICRWEKDAIVKGWSQVDGHRCVRIHAKCRADKDASVPGGTIDIFVDPRVGWLARKVVYALGGRQPLSFRRTIVVKDFYDGGRGVFFPRRVHRTINDGDQIIFDAVLTADELKINEPLPMDALTLEFPKNLLVMKCDQRFDDKPLPADVLLIGDGGKVIRTFPKEKPRELRSFLIEHGVPPSERPMDAVNPE